nr:MAG TPA: hypothetical protein [Caudoviricetes sp.]
MRLRIRVDRNYPFTIIPVGVKRHDHFKKEWLIYWFSIRISIAWRK